MKPAKEDDEFVIRAMTAEDAVGVAELVHSCYGDGYPHDEIYHPAKFFAGQERGDHISTVAATPDGTIAGHWAFVFHTPIIAESAMTMTRLEYRGHGIAAHLSADLYAKLLERGVKWIMGEPVLIHTATQQLALEIGDGMGAITGMRLKCLHHAEAAGFTEVFEHGRVSLAMAFGPIATMRVHELWIAPEYEELLGIVLEATEWPRLVRSDPPATVDLPETTVLTFEFDLSHLAAKIEIKTIGADLLAAVRVERDRARSQGALFIELRLPLGQPQSAKDGLLDLGFSFAALMPEMYPDCDLLVLQWLDDPHVERSTWQLLNSHIEQLADAIVAQAQVAFERPGSHKAL